MSTDKDRTLGLWFEAIIRHADGVVELKGVKTDPEKPVEEARALNAILNGKEVPQEASQTPTAPATPYPSKPLSALVEAFMADSERSNAHTEKTRQELKAGFDLMIEILGDRDVSTLTFDDGRRLKQVLTKLPSNRTKVKAYRGRTVQQLSLEPIPKADLLSVTSINKYLTRATSLFAWGIRHGYLKTNISSGLTLKKSKRADEDRDPYEDSELSALKTTVLSLSGYQKWVPLIGMYSAMRIEEICQLHLEDLQTVDEVLVFSIAEGDGKKLKTLNSKRLVPVHPALLDLGFQDYLDQVRNSGADRLFPDLNRGRDGFSQAASRWFGKFRKSIGLVKTFHSLRHTVSTRLREADVPMDLIADIMGHSRAKGETGRYAKGASVNRRLDALKKLTY